MSSLPITDLPVELRPHTKGLLHQLVERTRFCDESYQCETCLGTGISEKGKDCKDCNGTGLISAW